MATYNASNKSQLSSALNKAKAGDTISLSGGNYGSLRVSSEKYSGEVTITSNGNANFSAIQVVNSKNLTFDGLNLSGTGVGFKVSGSSQNIKIQDSDLTGFTKGITVYGGSGFKALNNDITKIKYDGIVIGHVQGVTLQGNEVRIQNASGDNHRDVIQFYNQGSAAPSANITIKNNLLTSDDGVTHGLFFGNADTKGSNVSEFYKNITIEGNTIKTGHKLALAIGGAQNVSIRKNVVVQSDDFSSKKTVNIPLIIIDRDAKGVSLSGNTVVKMPVIGDDSSNWKTIGTLNNTGSKIVSLGASVSNATAVSIDDTPTSSGSGTSSSGTGSGSGTSSSVLGNGSADEFRFSGSSISGTKTNSISADFTEGDKVVLTRYDAGTFEDVVGGNVVTNSPNGSYVKIDSVADLQELVASSNAISADVSGDKLTLSIDQDTGTHHLEFAGIGQEYLNSYDASLF